MNWPDYLIIGIVATSVLVGLLRGFFQEAFSLAVWVAAFLIAFQLSGSVEAWLPGSITLPSARTAVAFAGLFLSVLVVGGLLTYLVGKLVKKTGLSGTDRLMGGLFGACRGVLMVVILILVAGFTPIPADSWWSESQGLQALMPLAEWASGFLPESVSENFELFPVAEPAAEELST